MDTTVATGIGTRVHNIGLVSDRQTYLISSGGILIAGAILFGFSTLRHGASNQTHRGGFLFLIATAIAMAVAWASLKDNETEETHTTTAVEIPNINNKANNKKYFTDDPFTANLNGGSDGNFLQTTITLELSDAADHDVIHTFRPKIRNTILTLLSKKTLTQVSSAEGKNQLSEEIRNAINKDIKGKAVIKNVLFTSFVVQ